MPASFERNLQNSWDNSPKPAQEEQLRLPLLYRRLNEAKGQEAPHWKELLPSLHFKGNLGLKEVAGLAALGLGIALKWREIPGDFLTRVGRHLLRDALNKLWKK